MSNWKYLENIIYIYDGSFDGLLTIVFDSYLSKSIPAKIVVEEEYIPCLLEKPKLISTNKAKAKRILNGAYHNISYEALYNCYYAFLSCQKEKEIAIVKYLLHGFEVGPTIVNMLSIDYVLKVYKLKKNVLGEAHKLKGLVRLSEIGNNLWYAPISPSNNVIEQVGHFLMKRFPGQNIILHDRNRHLVFLYTEKDRKNYEIAEVSSIYKLPDFSNNEKEFQKLWKTFFKTIAIKERMNTKLQMQFMPKKYWKDLIEMSD